MLYDGWLLTIIIPRQLRAMRRNIKEDVSVLVSHMVAKVHMWVWVQPNDLS